MESFKQAQEPDEMPGCVTSDRKDRDRKAAAARQKKRRELQKPAAMMFEAPDWTDFFNPAKFPQRAGCLEHQLDSLMPKELVDNALDAGARVRCWADPDDEWTVFDDDGAGIDPECVKDLFCVNRPLRSSKHMRMPTRGMLGNGLRAVMAWARRLTVETRGVWQLLQANENTGLTEVLARKDTPPRPGVIVRVERYMNLGLTMKTLDLAGCGEFYTGPSSPWWYGPIDFRVLLQTAPADATAADVIRNMGLVPPKSIGARLARSVVVAGESDDLLKQLREREPQIKPKLLGKIGRDAYKDCTGYALAVGIEEQATGGLVPYVIEAHVRCTKSDERGSGRVRFELTVNRTATLAGIAGMSQPDELSFGGCGVSNWIAADGDVPTGAYTIYLSLITPNITPMANGKEPSIRPYVDALREVIGKAARQAHRAMSKPDDSEDGGKPAVPPKHKAIVLGCLKEAVAETSENGRYIFGLRNLFYRIRARVEQSGAGVLSWGNFTAIITDYEAENAPIPGMIRDERGCFIEPHTGVSIRLGTREVEDYERTPWAYHKILFCEKEDHVSIMHQDGFDRRNDCALMTNKGFSTRAGRDQIDNIVAMAEDEPVTVFCMHDGDAYGTMIAQTLQEATRARGARTIRIIDIGLHPWDWVGKLAVEDVPVGEGKPPRKVADYVLEREDGAAWDDWFQEHRIELNAMRPGEMIAWLEKEMAKIGKVKLVPPTDVADELLMATVAETIRDQEVRRVLREHDAAIRAAVDARVAAVSTRLSGASLVADIRKRVMRKRELWWKDVVGDIARRLTAE